jgi:proline iminopeptidase
MIFMRPRPIMVALSTAEPALYPPLEPYAEEALPVGDGHALHVEQSGNPAGFPVLFLHGGPGSRTRPLHRRFFDPRFYRIVLFDQRGCGRSTPQGCTEENTTGHLVADMERLRERLGLERMMLFGGSWGATLALAYATAHTQRVAAMVLRGVFLGSRSEIDWYLGGLGKLAPQAWQALSQDQGGDVLARYHRLVRQGDDAAARRWVAYEEAIMALDSGSSNGSEVEAPEAILARARVQLHYLAHDCFLEPGALLSGTSRLAGLPVAIVQGSRDLVCPPPGAQALAERLPGAELRLVRDGGHSAAAPEMAQALRRATDELRGCLVPPETR